MPKFEIKSRHDGSVLFSTEAGSFRRALEMALKSGANLTGADLTDGASGTEAHVVSAKATQSRG